MLDAIIHGVLDPLGRLHDHVTCPAVEYLCLENIFPNKEILYLIYLDTDFDGFIIYPSAPGKSSLHLPLKSLTACLIFWFSSFATSWAFLF